MDLSSLKIVTSEAFDRLGVYDRRLRASGAERLWFIPFYHRILRDDEADPFDFGLGVQRRHFGEQLAFFRERFHVCTVRDALAILESGNRPDRPLLSITFDDGYLDNIELGLPELRRHGCPATFFLSTGPIQDDRPFWWDLVIAMASRAVAGREDGTGLCGLVQDLGVSADPTDHKAALFKALEHLWQLPYIEIATLLDRHAPGWAKNQGELAAACPPRMRPHHARALLDQGMEIGAHTHNHPNLTKESDAVIREEIVRSKTLLESWIGQTVKGFATPHGYGDARVRTLCEEADIAYIATTDRGANHEVTPYHLTRFGAPNAALAHVKRSFALAAACAGQ